MATKVYDLEEKILDCWNVTNDIKVLNSAVQDRGLSVDETANVLLGLEYLYELKFQALFDVYTAVLAEQAPSRDSSLI